jgi:Domain of unknown function (DUF1902)
MSKKPVVFIISAAWDDEASVWSGHCDDIPAADAPSLEGLLDMVSAMALDLLPDNHPAVDPQSLFLQITALGPGAGDIPVLDVCITP